MADDDTGPEVPVGNRPRIDDYGYDLEAALSSVVSVVARVPAGAFTAETLGRERAGHGVVIGSDGLIATIGYLITEADEIWISTRNGRVVQGHAVGMDPTSGIGLVQALGSLQAPIAAIGDSRTVKVPSPVVLAASGGRDHAVAARIIARQEFAGYWEYLLEDALFTSPAHPHWGGAALFGPDGRVIGIGSLQVQHRARDGSVLPINMVVPMEKLPPVLDDLVRLGRPAGPVRPWLGLYAADGDGDVTVVGFAGNGPAQKAGLREGDVVKRVGGAKVNDLAGFYRCVWALGEAGVEVPLTLQREDDVFDVSIRSGDRSRFLRSARLH